MNETNKKLEGLIKPVGIRKDLPLADIITAMNNQAITGNKLLKEFYEMNPVYARFVTLIDSKQFLSQDEYESQLETFYQKYPGYRNAAFQKQVFNNIRECLPAGSLVNVKGGFAVMKTERRHGRSPNGTFPVDCEIIREVQDFKHTRGFITESEFVQVLDVMIDFLKTKILYETNRSIGQGELALPVRLITDKPSMAAFSMNMFRPPVEKGEKSLEPWTILASPSFRHPREERFIDGVFKFTDYKRRIILIGGSGYNGEIKKGMFAVANHIYPLQGHLSMHCSSIYDPKLKDVTLIFGLSGTGKSTVSSGVENGKILSDDETGINLDTGKTFNLEYGNYYKTGGLLSEKRVLNALENIQENQIAIYENVVVSPSGHVVFGADPTGNGRVSVQLAALEGAIQDGTFPLPKKIIILSRDVNAVLDPVNILTKEQIIFYLNLGYTSKTPGTETGITKPIPTYSKWEGGPFYDLKDEIIMKILMKFLYNNEVDGILLNSGEKGGPYGTIHNVRYPIYVTLEIAKNFINNNIIDGFKNFPENFEVNEKLGTIRPLRLSEVSEDINTSLNASRLWEINGFAKEYEEASRALFDEFKSHASDLMNNSDEAIQNIVKAGPR